MLNSLLNIVPGTGDKAGNYYFDNYGEPFIYAIIGFLVVFVGIILIIAIIWLLGLLMRKTDNFAFLTSKRKKKEAEKPENSGSEPSETVCQDGEAPDEVKAAIIAAVTAYMEASRPGCEFKVKRIKRL